VYLIFQVEKKQNKKKENKKSFARHVNNTINYWI
jgi:hypothetical protein